MACGPETSIAVAHYAALTAPFQPSRASIPDRTGVAAQKFPFVRGEAAKELLRHTRDRSSFFRGAMAQMRMRPAHRAIGQGSVAVTIMLGALAAGCAGADVPAPSPAVGLACVDDSLHCINQRQSALRQLVADKDRAWVKQPATPEAHATGVRLFAFKSKKRELTCEELAHGRREAEAAPAALRGAAARLTPAQVSRGTLFAAEVSRELGSEFSRRCLKK